MNGFNNTNRTAASVMENKTLSQFKDNRPHINFKTTKATAVNSLAESPRAVFYEREKSP